VKSEIGTFTEKGAKRGERLTRKGVGKGVAQLTQNSQTGKDGSKKERKKGGSQHKRKESTESKRKDVLFKDCT